MSTVSVLEVEYQKLLDDANFNAAGLVNDKIIALKAEELATARIIEQLPAIQEAARLEAENSAIATKKAETQAEADKAVSDFKAKHRDEMKNNYEWGTAVLKIDKDLLQNPFWSDVPTVDRLARVEEIMKEQFGTENKGVPPAGAAGNSINSVPAVIVNKGVAQYNAWQMEARRNLGLPADRVIEGGKNAYNLI